VEAPIKICDSVFTVLNCLHEQLIKIIAVRKASPNNKIDVSNADSVVNLEKIDLKITQKLGEIKQLIDGF
jgi:hypothetical protein